jgi:hypothetical protein
MPVGFFCVFFGVVGVQQVNFRWDSAADFSLFFSS